MSNRYQTQFINSFRKKLTYREGNFLVGASSAVTSYAGAGITSVAKTGTGAFRITLADKFPRFLGFNAIWEDPTGSVGGSGTGEIQVIGNPQTTIAAGYLDVLFLSAPGTIAVTNHADSAGTPAGSVAAPTGTNTATALNLATPAFSGTGFATAGQQITTTDNQTMPAVDTAAGMYFYCPADAAVAPVLILSNTIVAGAPAVLTVQGIAPATNAGAYKIVKNAAAVWTSGAAPAFTGSALGTHSHANTAAFTPASAAATHPTNGLICYFQIFTDNTTVLPTGW